MDMRSYILAILVVFSLIDGCAISDLSKRITALEAAK